MSIFNSSSRWAEPLPTGDNGTNDPQPNNFKVPSLAPVIIPTFYGSDVLPFQFAVDCQPLLNNFSSQRTNPYLYDIDYNFQGDTIYYSSSLAPVNFLQILSGSAVKAAVPESNYTELRSINPANVDTPATLKLSKSVCPSTSKSPVISAEVAVKIPIL